MAFNLTCGNGFSFNSKPLGDYPPLNSSSTFIDPTTDDADMMLSDTENIVAPKISSKRKLTASPMDQAVDHVELQASIERDVLHDAKPLPNWGSGNIARTFKVSKLRRGLPSTSSKKSTPRSSQSSNESSRLFSSQTSSRSMLFLADADYHLDVGRRNTSFAGKSTEPQDSDMLQNTSLQISSKRLRRQSFADMRERSSTERSGYSPPSPILLDDPDDDMDDTVALDNMNVEIPPDTVQDVIDLEDEEAAEEAEEVEDEESDELMQAAAVDETNVDLMNVIEISDDEDASPEPSRPQRKPRLEGRPSRYRNITTRFENLNLNNAILSISHGNHTYKPGDGVEFLNGTFMRIKTICRDMGGTVIVSGPLLVRHSQHAFDPKNLEDTRLLPVRRNELIWTVTIDGNGDECVDRELIEVSRPREIIFTNQSWPSTSSRVITRGVKRKHMFEQGPLFCRWKRIKQLQIRNIEIDQDYEDCVVRLSETEADDKFSVKPKKLRYAWRRQHVRAAALLRDFIGEDDNVDGENISQYTFADCFCGCGGASRGAKLAKLAIKWALDSDKMAVKSYRANFDKAFCHHEDVTDFLNRLRNDAVAAAALMVDILHLSPPCQAFSLARTHGSEEAKEMIEAVITSTGDLLKHIKPRVATMEETAGLYWAHKDWMALAIREMIDQGYSVRWKIMESQKYGVPQIRKRLVIIAAGPGETLPPFPTPSHGKEVPGLEPLATINDSIRNIPHNATHHQFISRFKDGGIRPAFSGNTQAKTITCGGVGAKGGANYHPDGKRPYTVRELSCLQTFPLRHKYGSANLTTAKRQIGNAFPPLMAGAVYKAISESLEESDEQEQGTA